MIKNLIPTWDNGLILDWHYQLSEFGELIEHLKLMPKLDTKIKHYSQYTEARYKTGCTIMSSINALATMLNVDFTPEEISSIYDDAESEWWIPWQWWSRYQWIDVVRKRWNKRHPENQMTTFVVKLFSEERNLVMEKLWTAIISINVDSAYRKDVRDNLQLDQSWPFTKSTGHATTMMYSNKYFCIDSIPKDTKKQPEMPMVYTFWDKWRLEFLNWFNNLRSDMHIMFFDSRLQSTDEEERRRLEKMKEQLEIAIKCNSELWNLTTQEAERNKRKEMNDYNRAKLKIVELMLR